MTSPAFEKRSNYRKLEKGKKVKDLFLVESTEVKQRSGAEPYLKLTVQDCVGGLEARIWDYESGMERHLSPGTIVSVTAEIDRFRNQIQLKIHEYFIREEIDHKEEQELYRCSPREPAEIEEELRMALRPETDPDTDLKTGVHNPWLIKLLKRYFRDEAWWRKFSTWPASKMYHHGYKHGLMEHTGNMLQLAAALANTPSCHDMDMDIVLTGIFLHDSGKIDEYNYTGGIISFSDFGELIPHIASGFVHFNKMCDQIEDFPNDLRVKIGHIILSHHKKLEWGSPVQPKTKEAAFIHYIDAIDSDLQTCREAEENHSEVGAFSFNKRFYHKYCSDPEGLKLDDIGL